VEGLAWDAVTHREGACHPSAHVERIFWRVRSFFLVDYGLSN
jgi:hypothetical protein